MRFLCLTLSSLVLLHTAVASAQPPSESNAAEAPSESNGAEAASPRPPLHLQVSNDLGVLSFGGLGVHAGAERGPWTAAVGFYRFESKNLFGGALGGFDDAFTLHVDFILAAQVGYFFNGEDDEGFYGKLIYQAKQQTVTHSASRERRQLSSHLLGPEVGYEWDVVGGLFLRPRLGVLYYAKAPQPGREPITIGGTEYDNPAHTWVDAYVTADLGFEFEL